MKRDADHLIFLGSRNITPLSRMECSLSIDSTEFYLHSLPEFFTELTEKKYQNKIGLFTTYDMFTMKILI